MHDCGEAVSRRLRTDAHPGEVLPEQRADEGRLADCAVEDVRVCQ
jgi:hypothetical protein